VCTTLTKQQSGNNLKSVLQAATQGLDSGAYDMTSGCNSVEVRFVDTGHHLLFWFEALASVMQSALVPGALVTVCTFECVDASAALCCQHMHQSRL